MSDFFLQFMSFFIWREILICIFACIDSLDDGRKSSCYVTSNIRLAKIRVMKLSNLQLYSELDIYLSRGRGNLPLTVTCTMGQKQMQKIIFILIILSGVIACSSVSPYDKIVSRYPNRGYTTDHLNQDQNNRNFKHSGHKHSHWEAMNLSEYLFLACCKE